MLFTDTIPSDISIAKYNDMIRKANKEALSSFMDTIMEDRCYLVLHENIIEDEFDVTFVSVHKADNFYPHFQVVSFLRYEDISFAEFRCYFLYTATDIKISVIEIDPNLFAKAERMASLYQASVKALFNGAAAAIEGHPHVVGLEFARPYIANANDSWSLLYVTIQFKVELAIQGQKRLYQFFSKCINENGRMKDSFLYSGRFPYSDCYEIPRPIFLSLIARHKSYCESILSLASEYICPPSTTIDIRHIL